MGKLEKDYFEGSKSVEQVGQGMLGTKLGYVRIIGVNSK